MKSHGLIAACFIGLAIASPAIAADKKTPNAPAPPAIGDLFWPLPPDPPRVRWLSAYSDLAKVKNPAAKKSGWLDKVTGTKTLDEKLELRKPYGITTDSRGRIYAADTELKTVFVIDPLARTVERREGSSRAPIGMPVGVAIDEEQRLFVSDAEFHTITCWDPTGQVIARFGTANLGRPGGIAIDRTRRRLYVADAKDSRIAVFDVAAMKFLTYFGKPTKIGTRENGTFLAPTNVAVDSSGNLYISDTWNYRVQVLSPDGKFIRAFGAQGDRPGEFIRPKGIAVDSEGHVYVADAEFNNFQILSAEGQPLLAIGTLGQEPGQFALIAGLSIDSKDRIFTTEMFHGRVQVFQYIRQPDKSADKGVTRSNIQKP